VSELQKAEKELRKSELQYHASMVASYLSPGDPCPVCGGTYTGSSPIHGHTHTLSELKALTENLKKQERELYADISVLKKTLQALEEEVENLKKEVEEYRKEIPPNLTERLSELEKLRKEKEELERNLRRYREALDKRVSQREEAQRKLNELTQKLHVVSEKLRERYKKIDEFKETHNRGDITAYELELLEELREVKERVNRTETMRERVRQELERLNTQLSRKEGELKALKEELQSLEEEKKKVYSELAGLWGTVDEPARVLELYMGQEEERKAEERIELYERSLSLLIQRQKELEEKLSDFPEVRALEEVKKEREELKEAIDGLSVKLGELRRELEHARTRLKRKEELKREIEELEEKLRVYDTIRNDFRADRFQRFVAEIMLRKVVDRASEYLYKFTGGYLFELGDAQGSRDRELLVVDTSTNQTRPVTSLSGGETFLASLSLAFGVSDILSGNANLESLFIDEGFGSLDQDTRERVGEILEAIKTNVNKMIGIISHIPDIAERFSERVIVEKRADSSYIRVVY